MLASSGGISDRPFDLLLEPPETKDEERKDREIEKAAAALAAKESADEIPLQDAFEELELQPEIFVDKQPTTLVVGGGVEPAAPPSPKIDADEDNLADALLLVEDEPLETVNKPAGAEEGVKTATDADQVKTTFDFECITIHDPAARIDKGPTLIDIELRNVSKEWIAYKIKSTSDYALTVNQPYFCGLLEGNSSVAHQLIARAGVRSSDDGHLILETFFLSLISELEKATPSTEEPVVAATAPVVENDRTLVADVVDAWEQALPDQLTTTKLRIRVVQKCDETSQEKFVIFCDRFRKEAGVEGNYVQKWRALENQVQNENCNWFRWLLFFAVFCCGYFTGAVIFARHHVTEGAAGKRKGMNKSMKTK